MTSPPVAIETAHLTLRALRPGDARAVTSLWAGNVDDFRDSFPHAVDQIVGRDDASGYVAARRADWDACIGFWFGMWERGPDCLVGQLHVKRLDWEVGRAELAYLVDAGSQGRGFASEAVRRIARTCFDDLALHKLYLRTIVGNEPSEAVARRCGFTLEGTLRGEFLAAGSARVDVRYFGLLATDPRP
jgi:RimJ/RimL family protein N-acetyltransferase